MKQLTVKVITYNADVKVEEMIDFSVIPFYLYLIPISVFILMMLKVFFGTIREPERTKQNTEGTEADNKK